MRSPLQKPRYAKQAKSIATSHRGVFYRHRASFTIQTKTLLTTALGQQAWLTASASSRDAAQR